MEEYKEVENMESNETGIGKKSIEKRADMKREKGRRKRGRDKTEIP